MKGNFSRANAKKSFNIYARKEYGAGTFQYDLLAGLPNKEKLVVRATLGEDALIHDLLKETGLPVLPNTPCLVFINGEFWGLYEIREKQDEKDIASFFGLSSKDLLVIKNANLIAGEIPKEIKDNNVKGVYRNLLSQISSLDLSSPQGYEEADTLIDVDNYTTYYAAIIYLNNYDYRANYTLWRTAEKGVGEYADGRWRWIFQDLDDSCSSRETIEFMPDDVIFSSLWKNSEFQTKFLTRLMDYANVELTPEYVKEYITPILTYYSPYLYETNLRYSKNNSSKKPGEKTISEMVSFFQTRREKMIKQLAETLQLRRGTSTLSLNGLPQGIALEINGHQAHLYGASWSGVYFTGCTVSSSAGDMPGCRFAGWYDGDKLVTAERTVEISTDASRTLTPVYEDLPVIVLMNETEIFYDTGRYGFTKRLVDSLEECVILPDDSVKAERKYVDSSILFQLDASVDAPQGFTLTIPLHHYKDVGGFFTLSVQDAYSSIKWKLYCKHADSSYQELPVEILQLPGGLLRLSFTIPEEQIDFQSIDIRLEAKPEKGLGVFSLRAFRLYGFPLDDAWVHAYEYARTAEAVGAEAQYLPDFERMDGWNAGKIEAEILVLRNKLQTMMAEKAVSTVGELGLPCPALEGLDAYPAAVIDDKLIEAFYNTGAIGLRVSVSEKVYLYEVSGNTMRFQNTVTANGDEIALNKRRGTFIFLDRPVEELRFRAAFDTEQIPAALLSSAFHDIAPQNHLWMNIETFTQYQEEASFDLPKKWLNQNVFIYRLQGEELEFVEEKSAADGALHFKPAAGRYLLLDDSLDFFDEEANWLKKEIEDMERIQALEAQKAAKFRKILLLIGGAVCAVIIAGVVYAILSYRKRKHGE